MRFPPVLAVALLLLCAARLPGQGREATILFKDGFHLDGKVVEKRDFIIDPASKAIINIPAASGFMYLDDVVRRIHFTPSQVQEVLPKKLWANLMQLNRFKVTSAGLEVLPTWNIGKTGDFNIKWERQVTMLTYGGSKKFDMRQRIIHFTPRHFRVQAVSYNWDMFYMTRELDSDTLVKLLADFFRDQKEIKEPDRHLQVARFLHQGGWSELANQKIDEIVKDFPELKESALSLRDLVVREAADIYAADIDRAAKIGQHGVARQKLDFFFQKGLDKLANPKGILELQDLVNKYNASSEKIRQASDYLRELPKKADQDQEFWTMATDAIAAELNHDTFDRLETFSVYAKQYLKEVEAKQKPGQSVEEVLALAVTGWLLGNLAAEPEVKQAQLLWRARQSNLEMQRTAKPAERNQINRSLGQAKDLTPDLLARVIRQLPPPRPAQGMKPGAPTSIDFEPDGFEGKYLVQLPPDYHTQRAFPVVILLHGSRERPETLLSRWSEEAAKNGYLLVAPEWGQVKNRGKYTYSAREHAYVLDCIKHLRQRFQIDSDRVFLFGWEEGAEMAYDVGLSHPDQFAGVLPMCGPPLYFPTRYWTNAQYLPFYIVEGDRHGANPKHHRSLIKDWIRSHYPCLYVEYKGRLSEWFDPEVPSMFDWMNRKKRANPLKELGRYHSGGGAGEEFRTNRPTDNRFYWIGTDSILPRYENDFDRWTPLTPPATLQATIAVGNEQTVKQGVQAAKIWTQINVRTAGVPTVSLWLSPTQIDFTKPVSVRINSSPGGLPKMLTPNVPFMLEDFYQHGDRQRLYFVKLDFKL